MNNSKNFLVLPGSYWQVPLVKKIKQMGHNAFVVNPAEDSPCFKYADDYLKSDIFDKEKVFRFCEQNKIDAVISDECDIATPLIAEIGEKFNLTTIGKDAAHLYTNKFAMREFCKEHKINYPEYKFCKTADEAIEFYRHIKKPIILKPLDCNASKGVFRADSEQDIIAHFEDALHFSRAENAILAERFIEGTEFTIDGIKTKDKHFTLAISEKKHFNHNSSIANELYFTHKNKNFDYEKLKKENDKFVLNSLLPFGLTHAEYKCENGEYYLIEIGARGGGNMISSEITAFMSGYSSLEFLINCTLGNVSNTNYAIGDEYKNRAAVLKFFTTPNNGGRVKDIKGIDFFDSTKQITKYSLNFQVGDIIENAVSDSARIGFYIACCDSPEELDDLIVRVENEFEIILE